jgi:hypothetical protein
MKPTETPSFHNVTTEDLIASFCNAKAITPELITLARVFERRTGSKITDFRGLNIRVIDDLAVELAKGQG